MPIGRGRLTDGELVTRLQALRNHKSNTAAAKAIGISVRNLQQSKTEAHLRGLTADTKLTNVEDKLKTKIKLLEMELAHNKKVNLSAEEIRREIYGLKTMTPDPPRWTAEPSRIGGPGIPMTIWSDWHWGEVVQSGEVGGVNTFNRKVAKERARKLVQTTIDLCLNHMVKPKYPGIIVCLGGDMITGAIHEELAATNDGYTQQSLLEVQEILIWAIGQLADKFGRVFLPCVVGNHGRETHKPRMKGRAYTSYEWNLYCQLELYFRGDRRVHFLISNDTDAYFKVLGHRFLLTHGDSLGVKGGDGIIGSLGPIARGTMKVGRSEAKIGRDFDTLIMGHWHTYIPRGEACPVIVNGALKGFDEYARIALRASASRPSQALWFVHADHGVTCQWQMYLDKVRKFNNATDWVTWAKQEKAHGNFRSQSAA